MSCFGFGNQSPESKADSLASSTNTLRDATLQYDKVIEAYMAKKDFESAIRVYNKLISVNRKLGDNWEALKNTQHIVETYMKMGTKSSEFVKDLLKSYYPTYVNERSEYEFMKLCQACAYTFESQGKPEDAKSIYGFLFETLNANNSQEKDLRWEFTLEYLAYPLKQNNLREALRILLTEKNQLKKITGANLKGANYKTCLMDCFCLAAVLDDLNEAEYVINEMSQIWKPWEETREAKFCAKIIEAMHSRNQEQFDETVQSYKTLMIFPVEIHNALKKKVLTKNQFNRSQPMAVESLQLAANPSSSHQAGNSSYVEPHFASSMPQIHTTKIDEEQPKYHNRFSKDADCPFL